MGGSNAWLRDTPSLARGGVPHAWPGKGPGTNHWVPLERTWDQWKYYGLFILTVRFLVSDSDFLSERKIGRAVETGRYGCRWVPAERTWNQ